MCGVAGELKFGTFRPDSPLRFFGLGVDGPAAVSKSYELYLNKFGERRI